MANVIIIGDDLTGSNATGALYARSGLRTVTVNSSESVRHVADEADVVLANIESRHLDPALAVESVRDVVNHLGFAPRLFVKRVDTTLRGNVGAESAALLDWVRAHRPGRRVAALVVPAFPESGRTTVGGMQLLDGVPIHRTWAAADPFGPVTASSVEAIIRQQADRPCYQVLTDVVDAGGDRLASVIAQAAADADFVIVDAEDSADIDRIALAASGITDVDFVIVDSGPFGAAFARAIGIGAADRTRERPILAFCGSLTQQTRDQIEHLERHTDARLITVAAGDDVGQVVTELRRQVDAGATIVGVRTAAPAGTPGPKEAAATLALLAKIIKQGVAEIQPAGLYATGGDVAVQVVSKLGAHGFRIEDHVIPLAVVGELVGGPYAGLPLVTKGGLIGGPDTATACLDTLRRKIRSLELQRLTVSPIVDTFRKDNP